MTYTVSGANNSAITFTSTSGTCAITSAGKTLGPITINGSGGTFQLQDDLNIGGNSPWTYTAGTIDTNSKKIICSGNNATFNGGSKTYYELDMTGAGIATVAGANTFTNLVKTGTAAKNDQLVFSSASGTTITGAFTVNGNSAISRVFIGSSTPGTQIPITNTGATMTWTNVDVQDISLSTAYDASAITGLSGDCGGNNNITFTTSASQTWSGTSGGNWSTNAWTSRVPLPQDDVVISSAFSASQTVTGDMPRLGRSIDWTGATGSPTFDININPSSIFGSLTLISGLTLTSRNQTFNLSGRSSYTLTNAGKDWGNRVFFIAAPSGTYTLQDDFTQGSSLGSFTVNSGTFDANGKNVTVYAFAAGGTNTRTVTMGSGTWTITGNATTVWQMSNITNLTFNRGNAVVFSYNGSTGTRNITTGAFAESVAPSYSFTGNATDTVTYAAAATTNCLNLDFTNFNGTMNFSNSFTIYGNFTLSSGLTVGTLGGTITFGATSGTKTITFNGKTFDQSVTFNGVGGTWQFQDAFTLGATRTITLTNGTIDANNNNVTTGTFDATNSNVRGITMGTGTWDLQRAAAVTVWNLATTTNLTFSGASSTIKISGSTASTRTFAGGGKTYGNLWFTNATTAGALTITGTNTFNDLRVDAADATAQTITFPNVTTTLTGAWKVYGSSGKLITCQRTGGSGGWTISQASGQVCVDYLSISNSTATGGASFYAGANTTDGGGNSGWTFTACPAGTTNSGICIFFQ